MKSEIWGINPYYATIALFSVAFLLHTYRVFIDETVFGLVPLWVSYFAIPVALALCWYNMHLDVE